MARLKCFGWSTCLPDRSERIVGVAQGAVANPTPTSGPALFRSRASDIGRRLEQLHRQRHTSKTETDLIPCIGTSGYTWPQRMIMTTLKGLTIVTALLVGGASLAIAQNGPATGGQPPVAGGAAGNPAVPATSSHHMMKHHKKMYMSTRKNSNGGY